MQRIMITRPAHQAGKLVDDIEAAGGTTFIPNFRNSRS